MTGGSHVIVGVSTIVAIAMLTGEVPDRIGFGMVILGSVLPDIDNGGIITSVIPGGRSISKGINAIVGHRGFTHWLIVPIALILSGIFYSEYLIWLGIGYLSHILADSCTLAGVPMFAPFSDRIYGLRFFRTGGVVEWLISGTLIAGIFYFGTPIFMENVFPDGFKIR